MRLLTWKILNILLLLLNSPPCEWEAVFSCRSSNCKEATECQSPQGTCLFLQGYRLTNFTRGLTVQTTQILSPDYTKELTVQMVSSMSWCIRWPWLPKTCTIDWLQTGLHHECIFEKQEWRKRVVLSSPKSHPPFGTEAKCVRFPNTRLDVPLQLLQ